MSADDNPWNLAPMTPDEAVAKLRACYAHSGHPAEAADGEREVGEFRAWLVANGRQGDALCWYNVGDWASLCGEAGFAIVRDGEVAFKFPVIEN